MAKLTDEEANVLKRLQAKMKQPDEPPSQKVLNISVDLGDEAQVSRAQKLGLFSMFEDDDDGDGDGDGDKNGDGDGDGGGDETPRRKGYFGGK